jgi:hypothetical protein
MSIPACDQRRGGAPGHLPGKRKSVATKPWLAQAKRVRKPFEGHIPAASQSILSRRCNDVASKRRPPQRVSSHMQKISEKS